MIVDENMGILQVTNSIKVESTDKLLEKYY